MTERNGTGRQKWMEKTCAFKGHVHLESTPGDIDGFYGWFEMSFSMFMELFNSKQYQRWNVLWYKELPIPTCRGQRKHGVKKELGLLPTWGCFLHLLPLPLLLLSLKIYRGTHKVWLQHSRSLDHSDILLLTAMFTHPLLGTQPASLGLQTPP